MAYAGAPEQLGEIDLVRELDEIGQGLAGITPHTDVVGLRFEAPKLSPQLPVESTTVDFFWYPDGKLNREDGTLCVGGLAISEVLKSERQEHHVYRFAYRIDNHRRIYGPSDTADVQTLTQWEEGAKNGLSYWGGLEDRRDGIEKVQRCLQVIRAKHLIPGQKSLGIVK